MPSRARSVHNDTPSSAASDQDVSRNPQNRAPRRRMGARDLALVASFAALIVVLGIPGAIDPVGSGVPITLQSLGVMLAGSLLGARRGAAAVAVVVVLCAVGLPVLAGGRGGLGVFASPTVGFLFGYIAGAAVIGWIVARRSPIASKAVWVTSLGILVGGIGVIHALGIPGMMWRAKLSLAQAFAADVVFMPGDLVKAVVAIVVTLAVHRAFPELLPARGGRRAS